MNCSKCGGDTKLMAGVSQKNGKPWTGYKCQDRACGNMDFQKTNQNISPKPNKLPSNEPEMIKMMLDVLRKLDELKALCEIRNQIFKGTKLEAKPKGEEPF
jgi:hypothetical protein